MGGHVLPLLNEETGARLWNSPVLLNTLFDLKSVYEVSICPIYYYRRQLTGDRQRIHPYPVTTPLI
jgi:hypothetical protein